MKLYVVKKDGTREIFNVEKIINAVNKSAARILYKFSEDEIRFICNFAQERAESLGKENIDIQDMHNIVEGALDHVNPAVAKSYRDYRNYKKDFVHMMDDVYTKSQSIRYIGDKSNANTDSALVATKRSLIFNELNKELYRKFFMNRNELQACRDGYIYIHDQSARLDTMNCTVDLQCRKWIRCWRLMQIRATKNTKPNFYLIWILNGREWKRRQRPMP